MMQSFSLEHPNFQILIKIGFIDCWNPPKILLIHYRIPFNGNSLQIETITNSFQMKEIDSIFILDPIVDELESHFQNFDRFGDANLTLI